MAHITYARSISYVLLCSMRKSTFFFGMPVFHRNVGGTLCSFFRSYITTMLLTEPISCKLSWANSCQGNFFRFVHLHPWGMPPDGIICFCCQAMCVGVKHHIHFITGLHSGAVISAVASQHLDLIPGSLPFCMESLDCLQTSLNVSAAMNWRLIQGVHHFSVRSGIGSSHPVTLHSLGCDRYWMDIFYHKCLLKDYSISWGICVFMCQMSMTE